MSKRRRHVPQTPHAETEVWPAYVDVLSAAFVFVLLAFAALLTRDVAEQEERIYGAGMDRAEAEKYQHAFAEWLRDGQLAVNHTAAEMANELTPVGLAASCTLPDAAQLAMNPNLVAAFSEKLVELDAARRHPVTLVCTFSPEALGFPEGETKPEPIVRARVVPKLVALAQKIVDRNCGLERGADAWCSSGLEIIGHTDCRPVTKNDSTNWELGSDRASWVLRQMLAGVPSLGSLRQESFRVGAGGRADREPRVDTSSACGNSDSIQSLLSSSLPGLRRAVEADLAQNRRVELLVFLRTKPLAPRPLAPNRAGP